MLLPLLIGAALSNGLGGIPEFHGRPYTPPAPKNKYGLTDEELELMSTMSPKEKKIFLKNRRTA